MTNQARTITDKHIIQHTSEDHEIADIIGSMIAIMRGDAEQIDKPDHTLGFNLMVCYDEDMPESIIEAHKTLYHRALPIALEKIAENGLQAVDMGDWHAGHIETDEGTRKPTISAKVHIIHPPTNNYASSVLQHAATHSIAHMKAKTQPQA